MCTEILLFVFSSVVYNVKTALSSWAVQTQEMGPDGPRLGFAVGARGPAYLWSTPTPPKAPACPHRAPLPVVKPQAPVLPSGPSATSSSRPVRRLISLVFYFSLLFFLTWLWAECLYPRLVKPVRDACRIYHLSSLCQLCVWNFLVRELHSVRSCDLLFSAQLCDSETQLRGARCQSLSLSSCIGGTAADGPAGCLQLFAVTDTTVHIACLSRAWRPVA